MLLIKAYAEPKNGRAGSGSQNRAGSGSNFARPASQRRRGAETMSAYYRRTGQSALGATSRTRGRLTTIR